MELKEIQKYSRSKENVSVAKPPFTTEEALTSPPAEVLSRLGTSPQGLDSEEVTRRLEVYGTNELLNGLTAEHLRGEIYSLLIGAESTINVVVMVSHNVDEMVELADRVLVLSNRPAKVLEDMPIDLARPRDTGSQRFHYYVDKIYSLLT